MHALEKACFPELLIRSGSTGPKTCAGYMTIACAAVCRFSSLDLSLGIRKGS